MKDLRELDFCLGIQMIRNRTKWMINLGQVKYISFQILKWFKMEESKRINMPIDINVQLNKEQVPSLEKEIVEIWRRYHTRWLLDVSCTLWFS